MPEYIRREMEKTDPDFPMLIFPSIPVGLSVEHLHFCGSVSFRPDTYYRLLYEITESIARHGFRKFVFLVCHGGNRPVVDALARQLRFDLDILPFVLSSGAFSHPDVLATISEGNTFDFHGGDHDSHCQKKTERIFLCFPEIRKEKAHREEQSQISGKIQHSETPERITGIKSVEIFLNCIEWHRLKMHLHLCESGKAFYFIMEERSSSM